MRVFVDGRDALASEVIVSAFKAAGHEVVRPEAVASAAVMQVLALGADFIVLDAVPTAETTPRDPGAQHVPSRRAKFSRLVWHNETAPCYAMRPTARVHLTPTPTPPRLLCP
jgi:hypothetical protein